MISSSWKKYKERDDNVFEIDNAETYSCHIERYKSGLSELWINAQKGTDVLSKDRVKLVFTSPYFFDGPFGWHGANFGLAPQADKIQLFEQLGWFGILTQDEEKTNLVTDFRLYVIYGDPGLYKIRILAKDAYRVD